MAETAAIAFDLAIVAASIGALWVGAALLVENAARIARRAGLSELVVGLTVVGFGTSTPELATSVRAALAGAGDVAVANVVGSNLFNVGVVLALVGVMNPVIASRPMVRRDGPVVVAVAVLAAAVVRDGLVGRTEGAVLVALLVGYVAWLLVRGSPDDESVSTGGSLTSESPTNENPASETSTNETPTSETSTNETPTSETSTNETPTNEKEASKNPAKENQTSEATIITTGGLVRDEAAEPTTRRSAAVAVAGLVVIVVGANFLVSSATDLARLAGISEWAIGETIVAVGTSTPEIAASVVAARRGKSDLAAGNLLGSNAFNVLGILGLSAVVRPLSVSPVAFDAALWLVGLSAFVIALLATRGRLTRVEGLVALLVTLGRWVIDAL